MLKLWRRWLSKNLQTFCLKTTINELDRITLVRCAPVASPVDKFPEITTPVPNYSSLASKWISFLNRSWRDFIHGDIWTKWWSPLKCSIFKMILGLRTSFSTWRYRFCIKSSVMDTWYLVSLVTYLNWPGFLENFLASRNLQQLQGKSSMNTHELNWLSLWQTTTEYLQN